jgi:hypothetical protein
LPLQSSQSSKLLVLSGVDRSKQSAPDGVLHRCLPETEKRRQRRPIFYRSRNAASSSGLFQSSKAPSAGFRKARSSMSALRKVAFPSASSKTTRFPVPSRSALRHLGGYGRLPLGGEAAKQRLRHWRVSCVMYYMVHLFAAARQSVPYPIKRCAGSVTAEGLAPRQAGQLPPLKKKKRKRGQSPGLSTLRGRRRERDRSALWRLALIVLSSFPWQT